MQHPVSAYVPYYNNADTIGSVIESLSKQSYPIQQFLVIDDGSDIPLELPDFPFVTIIRLDQNCGRGAARARGMKEAQHEFVLCCDSTNILEPRFLELSMLRIENPCVAAVYGSIDQKTSDCLAHRWRGRHLFRNTKDTGLTRKAPFATWGALVRRSAVMSVGNYNPNLRHSEDADLGLRLLKAGFDIIKDPQLVVYSISTNTLFQVYERHLRWYAGADEKKITVYGYLKYVWFSLKVMVAKDLMDRDYYSIPITLLYPHYRYWMSWWRHYNKSNRDVT